MQKHRQHTKRVTIGWPKNTRWGENVREIAGPFWRRSCNDLVSVLRIGKAMHYSIETAPAGLALGKQAEPSLATNPLPVETRAERFARLARRQDQLPLGGLPKRIVDITVASIALILLLPLMLIVTALIRMVMGGPVIFAQKRIGLGGRQFSCFKFRTMVADGDDILRRHLDANPQAAQEWKETRKLANDPRVGCLGNILRKSSIDELPQLFNVLRGDMSLVGPRPVVPDELAYYGRHVRAYLKARPGLTGVWQVSGRNRLSYAARVARDRLYVRHWSLAVDLAVLIKTIPAILKFSETA
jgi:exopolysaccharide production protein ExoY